jgi:phospholipid/cholesterol/gamma-HCH transport system permease protein
MTVPFFPRRLRRAFFRSAMTDFLRPITLLFLAVVGVLRFLGELTYLLLDSITGVPRSLFSRQGRRLGWQNLWEQMDRVGVRSVPIVCLVLYCIGAILAFQMAPTLQSYGAITRVPDIVAIAVSRELGPLVSAIVLTGFAGASIAAELGTMVVSEEIEALEAHAISPIRFLVVPRVLATTVMMVCIAVVGDIAGGFGGWTIGRTILGISSHMYIQRSLDTVRLHDFVTGLLKAGVFGLLISGMACRLGLSVTGGAQGVGVATTRTVVLTIVALILVDLLFSTVFYAIGW